MTVTLVNGHVLFSHLPDWSAKPKCKRVWETAIAETLPGMETRSALRVVARRSLTFAVTPGGIAERVRLESRLDAANLSGLACAPLHGRGSALAANQNAGDNVLHLAWTCWYWVPGDYVILVQDDLTFDVQAVRDVKGLALTLQNPLAYAWPAAAYVWPVIFGKLDAAKETLLDGFHASQGLTITERTAAHSAQIGVLPAQPAGVGTAAVGTTDVVG